MSESFNSQDDTRLCPTCRSVISIWATKCRFCGDSVGRPRQEETKLTVHDLGGESRSTYTVSGNVKDALEAFRAEEEAAKEAEQQRREAAKAARKKAEAGTPPGSLPELDAYHKELAQITELSKPFDKPGKGRGASQPVLTKKLFTLGAVIAGLVILYFGGSFALASIQSFLESRGSGSQIIYNNQALEMLAAGAPVIDALEEANDALKMVDSPENAEIAEQVRSRFIDEINSMVASVPYDKQALIKASEYTSRANIADGSEKIRELRAKVEGEVAAYRLLLININEDGSRATFKVFTDLEPREETVAVGDYVDERFVLQRIIPSLRTVHLADSQISGPTGPRRLQLRLNEPISAR